MKARPNCKRIELNLPIAASSSITRRRFLAGTGNYSHRHGSAHGHQLRLLPSAQPLPGLGDPPIGLGKYFRVAKSFPISRLVIRLIVGEGIQREGDSMLLVLEHPDDAWVELMKDLPVRVGCED